jgi:hypothetical protein
MPPPGCKQGIALARESNVLAQRRPRVCPDASRVTAQLISFTTEQSAISDETTAYRSFARGMDRKKMSTARPVPGTATLRTAGTKLAAKQGG